MSRALAIKGFAGYYVTDTGCVYSRKDYNNNPKGRIVKLKPANRGNGYLFVVLLNNNHRFTKSVHRLVAEAFLPNVSNKTEVNHINGNRQDNSVQNLEWVTRSENELHKYRVLKRKPTWKGCLRKDNPLSKPVLKIKNGIVIKKFCSISDGADDVGVSYTGISACLRGKQKTAGGYEWAFDY